MQPTPVLLPGESHRGSWRASLQSQTRLSTQASHHNPVKGVTIPIIFAIFYLLEASLAAAAAKLLVVSHSVRPHRRQPTRLLCPWDFPGKNTGVGCHFLLQCMKVKSESEVAQSCLTLHDPMHCSPPGSSVHGIFQARVLEWGAIAFSKKQVLDSILKERM